MVTNFAGEGAIQETESRMVDDREAVEEGEEYREQQHGDQKRTNDDHEAILSRLSPRDVAAKVYVGNESCRQEATEEEAKDLCPVVDIR